MKVGNALAAVAVITGLGAPASAAVVFADFENGSTSGFGTLTNSGVQPFVAPVTGTVTTPSSGSNLTQVLDVTASGYNGGLPNGAAVGYDFVANGTADEFLANDILSFTWEVPPSSTPSGYSQLYEIVLNSQGGGYVTIGGSSRGDATLNQYPPYTGQTNTYTFDYSAYKATIAADAGWIQLGIVTNNGGGAPTNFYFDNFSLSQVPEPTSLAVLGLGGLSLLARRRRRT